MKFNVVYTLIQQRLNWNCIKKLQSIQVFFPRACLRFFDCNFFKAVLAGSLSRFDLFCHHILFSFVCSETPEILRYHLTLFKTRGADYARHITTCPPIFSDDAASNANKAFCRY